MSVASVAGLIALSKTYTVPLATPVLTNSTVAFNTVNGYAPPVEGKFILQGEIRCAATAGNTITSIQIQVYTTTGGADTLIRDENLGAGTNILESMLVPSLLINLPAGTTLKVAVTAVTSGGQYTVLNQLTSSALYLTRTPN